MSRRHAKRDSGVLDLALRADEALRHRGLRDEERAGDLLRLEAAQRPQCERDLRVERERRMAAGEDELEALVRDRRLVHLVLRRFRHVEQAALRCERAVAADAIDRTVSRCCHEPRAWVGGRTVAWPALGGDREGFLGGFLGEIEVTEEADQAGEDTAPLVAEGLLEDR